MKYEDDELAEAALLLAHEAERDAMPPHLEKRIMAQGRAIVGQGRGAVVTTTRAAAVAMETEPQRIAPPSRLRAFAPWMVAAACFALVVYQWRLSSLQREPRMAATGVASEIRLTDRDGKVTALLRWGGRGAASEVEITASLPGAASDHYQVFATSADGGSAVPLADFRCVDGCVGATIALEAESLPSHQGELQRRIVLTRQPVGRASFGPETTVLAEGKMGARAP